MTETTAQPTDAELKVFDGIEFAECHANVPDAVLLDHVRQSIRRGHPQVWRTGGVQQDRVVLVGGGPSLADTEQELRDLVFAGAKLVTVNGAYQWCLARNLQPKAQIVLDARAPNARFLQPDVAQCRYYLASQCHPETWDAVDGRPFVGIFHDASDEQVKAELDAYYFGQWHGVAGGTTVGTRAIVLLRMLGYLRFDLFGFDSCWMGGQHHAYDQPENEADKRLKVTVAATGGAEARVFRCAPWHLKQLEDLLRLIRFNGQHFLLNIHGDGLLAYALKASADVQLQVEPT